MPLSKCRRCGKYVPNPYRPYHEKVACLELKRSRGDLIFKEVLPRVRKPKPMNIHENQHKLLEWVIT